MNGTNLLVYGLYEEALCQLSVRVLQPAQGCCALPDHFCDFHASDEADRKVGNLSMIESRTQKIIIYILLVISAVLVFFPYCIFL